MPPAPFSKVLEPSNRDYKYQGGGGQEPTRFPTSGWTTSLTPPLPPLHRQSLNWAQVKTQEKTIQVSVVKRAKNRHGRKQKVMTYYTITRGVRHVLIPCLWSVPVREFICWSVYTVLGLMAALKWTLFRACTHCVHAALTRVSGWELLPAAPLFFLDTNIYLNRQKCLLLWCGPI